MAVRLPPPAGDGAPHVADPHPDPVDRVAVVAVNYNAVEHVAHLLFSLHTSVAADLVRIVIVDNGSNDGSRLLLKEAEKAGLCDIVLNEDNRYHGPALNQGFDYIAAQEPDVRYLWFLDSDCVVLDRLLVRRLVDLATRSGARLIGEPAWNRWQEQMRFGLYSLFVEGSAFTRSPRFEDSGDPSSALEGSVRAAGVTTADFPFTENRHLIHVGRATLRGVAERGERTNRYHDWAVDHAEPHFQGVAGADVLYRAFCEELDAAVPELTRSLLAAAISDLG